MTDLLITAPLFYAVAIPAVLLLGISKSGFGAGFGSLAVPMLTLAVTVPQAVAILMPVLLVMDVLGIAAFRKDFDARLLRFLLPFAVLGLVIGALLFSMLNTRMVAALVGFFTLLFLLQRTFFPPKPDQALPPRWWGAVLTTVSGFTSFVAHAGGPPINAYAMALRLSPVAFTATLSLFFFVVNLCKWVPYYALGLLDMRNLVTSLVLLPVAPIGVWIGVHWARRIRPVVFYRFLSLGMLLTGVKLLWDGLA